MNEPTYSSGQRIRMRKPEPFERPRSQPPDAGLIGKLGVVEAYGGWFGSGSTYPVRFVTHNYIIRLDGADKAILMNEEWLEPAPSN